MSQLPEPSERPALRQRIDAAYLADEEAQVNALLPHAMLDEAVTARIEALARELVLAVRERPMRGTLEAFLHEYDLSSQEGVMLMCLAEALLRIPDAETADRLIKDKLTQAEWNSHLGQSSSLFVNASTWGLILTGRIVRMTPDIVNNASSFFSGLISRSGEPVIRLAIKRAMRIIGHQFIMGHTIDEAISDGQKGGRCHYSFDMLGEAALTAADARRYFEAYQHAITTIGAAVTAAGEASLFDRPGISIKLSALHPRYHFSQRQRVLAELTPQLLRLARQAKAVGINLTVDAEEAGRLDLSLDIFEAVYRHPDLDGWAGFGLAVQAYQKRAFAVIDWLREMAAEVGRRIPLRLVKGAYWDSEIKRAQELGLKEYPVFTRKSSTDLSFLACAKKLLDAGPLFYPQFATHNAHSVAAIITLAGPERDYEFQRLHGMGEALFEAVLNERGLAPRCRVYAPVGNHRELLPYLVRRLLENGANTSFVNRIVDELVPVDEIIADPVRETAILQHKRHPYIPLPRDIFGPQRRSAQGINLCDLNEVRALDEALAAVATKQWISGPIINGELRQEAGDNVTNPACPEEAVGRVSWARAEAVEEALCSASAASYAWGERPVTERAALLRSVADLLERQQAQLISLLIRESGRTVADALAEVRESIDFCRYYAQMAERDFATPTRLPGITGESNELRLVGRGLFVCISPWNFPVAIFSGQIAAALVTGNSVIAKPASPTPLCAAEVVRLFHQAGVPPEVLQLLPGSGEEVGMRLVNDPRVAGIAFTGSTASAHQINIALAQRPDIIPFIAETGGLNSMIIDSSALPQQVVEDVITSAFNSAGQRCSALRVLFIQNDIAPQIIELLQGAMDELAIGDPTQLSSDIGPLINAQAKARLMQYRQRLERDARLIKQLTLPPACSPGSFLAPCVYEIERLNQLPGEVFGPILHIIRYEAAELDRIIDEINATGYGLTLGIHSRVDATVQYISRRLRVGNAYVNRNMIGAVVGTQPFGGEGLSGTGPKAGGPFYLYRFATERVLTINTTAVGGNATLLSLQEEAQFRGPE